MYSPGDVPVSTMPSKNQRRVTKSLSAIQAQLKSSAIKRGTHRRPNNRRSSPKKSKRRSNVHGGMLSRELAMSWQNPFEFSACIPDGSNGTGCFSLKQDLVLQTGALGTCTGIVATPLPNAFYYTDNGNTSAFPVSPVSFTAATQIANVTALYGKYRPVSMGMRAAFVGSTSNDQGTILVGQVNGSLNPSLFNGVPITTVANAMSSYKI